MYGYELQLHSRGSFSIAIYVCLSINHIYLYFYKAHNSKELKLKLNFFVVEKKNNNNNRIGQFIK